MQSGRYNQGKLGSIAARAAGTTGGATTRSIVTYGSKSSQWLNYPTENIEVDGWLKATLFAGDLAIGNVQIDTAQAREIAVWLRRAVISSAGESNEGLAAQFNVPGHFDADAAFASLDTRTLVVQLRPENAGADHTIRDAQVSKKLWNFAEKYGFPFEEDDLLGTEHASPAQYPGAYNPAVAAALYAAKNHTVIPHTTAPTTEVPTPPTSPITSPITQPIPPTLIAEPAPVTATAKPHATVQKSPNG
jgi:hypothetical protein